MSTEAKILAADDAKVMRTVITRKLEEAGYLKCSKDFADRKPRTRYSLSAAGRRALQKYINHMEALISSMKNS